MKIAQTYKDKEKEGLNKDKIEIVVSTPDALIWQGRGISVSSKNSEGDFDILAEHANFITIIEKEPIIVRTFIGEKEFEFESAIVYNYKNTIHIYGNL